MIKNELKSLLKNKFLLLVLIVILLIPSIYAGLFLSSMWDPYGNLDKLPVAVVNKDEPVDYEGKRLAIGETLTESLSENDSMNFILTDEATAAKGLSDGKYYMVITVPDDFSKNASTVMDAEPKQMNLQYATNPGMNYISSKLSQSAIKEVKASIMEQVTRSYTESVFASLEDIGAGFDKAADGTSTMLDGEQALSDGANTLTDKLGVLSQATLTLTDGSSTLQKGLDAYLDGVGQADQGVAQLESGAQALVEGTGQLQAGSQAVLDGLTTMQSNINESLSTDNVKNLQYASDSLVTLNKSIQQLNTAVNGDGSTGQQGVNLSGLTDSLASVGTSLTTAGKELNSAAGNLVGKYAATGNTADLGGSAAKVITAYKTLSSLYQNDTTLTQAQKEVILSAMNALYDPSNQIDTNTAYDYIAQATSNVSTAGENIKTSGNVLTGVANSGLTEQVITLKSSIKTLATASDKLLPASSKGITSLLTGMQKVQTGLNQTKEANGKSGLVEGMSLVNTGLDNLATGISGANGLQAGIAKLKSGTAQLTAKNQDIRNGANALTEGSGKIADGAKQLENGSKELGTGIEKLMSGTNTLNEELTKGGEQIKSKQPSSQNIDMFVSPVITEETQITKVQDNGHAMAAYMMSVGLWVGCLAFCLMYPLMSYKGELKNGLSWWGSKAIVAYTVAISMGIVLLAALQMFNGLEPVAFGKTMVVSIAAAMCFMSIMYFFNVLMGKAGSFFMLIFMVLQLAGSAGTYPIEISGDLAAALHKYVPFTYSVRAFRSTISGGINIWASLKVLITLTLVFTALTVVLFEYRANRIKKNEKIFYHWIEEKGLA